LTISVVIVNWNGKRFLDKCLRSVYGEGEVEGGVEVIFVDNGSTDGSVEFVRENPGAL
jgi:glycosyltransferase involved in cell wall biosynthesis